MFVFLSSRILFKDKDRNWDDIESKLSSDSDIPLLKTTNKVCLITQCKHQCWMSTKMLLASRIPFNTLSCYCLNNNTGVCHRKSQRFLRSWRGWRGRSKVRISNVGKTAGSHSSFWSSRRTRAELKKCTCLLKSEAEMSQTPSSGWLQNKP